MNKVDVIIRDDNWAAGDCLLIDETPYILAKGNYGFLLVNLETGVLRGSEVVANANDLILRIIEEGHSVTFLGELHITGRSTCKT